MVFWRIVTENSFAKILGCIQSGVSFDQRFWSVKSFSGSRWTGVCFWCRHLMDLGSGASLQPSLFQNLTGLYKSGTSFVLNNMFKNDQTTVQEKPSDDSPLALAMSSLLWVVSSACVWVGFCFLDDVLLAVSAFLFLVLYMVLPVQCSISFSPHFWFSLFHRLFSISHAIPRVSSSCPLQRVGAMVSKAAQMKAEIPFDCFSQVARSYRILYI